MNKRTLLGMLLLASSIAPDAQADETRYESAPVVIANRTIIVLRGPIAGYTAAERAQNTMQRIEQVLAANPNPDISFDDFEGTTRVKLGGKHAFLITSIDVDKLAGETTQLVAQAAGERLQLAIAEWREEHSPRHLALSAAVAAGATLVYATILWVLYRGGRWIGGRVSEVAELQARKLQIGSVRHLIRWFVHLLAWLITITVSTVWLAFVLKQFPYTRSWGEDLGINLIRIATQVALAISGALPGLFLVAIVFLLARALIGITRVFFDRVESGRTRVSWLEADTVPPTRRIFSFVVWTFALAMAYPYLPGAQTQAFKGLSVLIGLMLSLGGASLVGQAFSGLILIYTRVMRRGDYVRIGDTEGTVMDLGMFATRLRTGLGEEVTLANSNILSTTTKNYSRAVRGTGYVLDTAVTIGYSTPWRQVHAMLEEAAGRIEDIAQDPKPFVRQTALSDYYAEYRLVAYTPLESPSTRVDVLNRLHGAIQDVFNEHGVQIMSPHYMMDPAKPQVVPKERWYAAPAKPPAEQ